MQCPKCTREISTERLFCSWCESYVIDPAVGEAASVGRRFAAALIDPFALAAAVVLPPLVIGGLLGETLGFLAAFATVVAVIVVMLRLFVRGQTLGKYLLNQRVVERRLGQPPGFARMLVRETIGKFLSGFFFSLGFFWAIWDKDHQAWHDKIAGTVVVKEKSRHDARPAIAV
jgi:uncharacterized RDD family membrane protein YckC